ncbi:MAG TPA: O-antigen ligase family protein [Gaiellaceae bacterium]|nr:O-antigen ligase family protein [Gaiellaceae bacterium]
MTTLAPPRTAAAPADIRLSRARPPVALATASFLVLVLLAFADGGYRPAAWGWAALLLCWAAAGALIVRPRIHVGALERATIAALGALLAWTLLSTLWTPSPTRTLLEAQRTTLYLSALVALVLVARRGSWEGLVVGVWAAIAATCAYSLGTRLLPERLGVFDPVAGYRLSEPLGYWNALGILAALGILLALGLAARSHSLLLRSLAAGSLVVMLAVLYLTFGRGPWIALAAALVVFVAVDSRRLQLVTYALVLAPWPALAVAAASRSPALLEPGSALATAPDEGRRLLVIVAGLSAAAALAAVGLALLQPRVTIPRAARLGYALALTVAVIIAVAALFVRFGSPPTVARDAYAAFRVHEPPAGPRRLFDLSGNGRDVHWRLALRAYGDHPWLGSGAGTFELYWLRHRPYPAKVRDAHSLYFETLAELGPLGLALLVTALCLPLAAGVAARRAPLVPPAFAAYVAYLVHAGADWDWEMPVVTLAGLVSGASLLLAARSSRATRVSRRLRLGVAGAVALLGAFAFTGLTANSALSAARDAAEHARTRTQIEESRKAMRWAPWSSQPWQLLGEAQLAARQPTAARESFRRAIEKDRSDWRLWFELALASGGRSQERALAEARRLNPLDPEIAELAAALAAGARSRR